MNDSNDDRYLHLKSIDVNQLVVGDSPNGIDTKWIDALRIGRLNISILSYGLFVKVIARSKNVDVHTEEIVIDPPTVKSEETHHQYHVSELTDER